jgi:hypothetical protein
MLAKRITLRSHASDAVNCCVTIVNWRLRAPREGAFCSGITAVVAALRIFRLRFVGQVADWLVKSFSALHPTREMRSHRRTLLALRARRSHRAILTEASYAENGRIERVSLRIEK